MKQFINSVTSKWAQTKDVNKRYYEFSEAYYKFKKFSPALEKHLGMIKLGDDGQLGDFFYLNYFFGLPN
uniref:Peptidase_M13 domain-containing protein n=1 Tax=Panagrellus redivivus TaxID=6233 RepID=A0A7E4UY27_PANRE